MSESEYYHETIEGREGFACLLEGLANAVRTGEETRVVLVYDQGEESVGEVSCHLGDGTLLDAIQLCGHGQLALAGMLQEDVGDGE